MENQWFYDFNASGCWIVDGEGFTVIPHMPITVEQAKEIVQQHNRAIGIEPDPKDQEIFFTDDGLVRHSIMTDKRTIQMLEEYGLIFLESGDNQYMPTNELLAECPFPIAFLQGVIWANDH